MFCLPKTAWPPTCGMSPQNGTAGGQTWQRRSTVSLTNQWGELRLGRDYTATFWNSTIFDPFGTNGVGSAGNLVFLLSACTPTNVNNCTALPSGGQYGTAVRDDNLVAYFLPAGIAGGLYGQIQAAPGANQAGVKYWGGCLGYAAGPFNIAGSYGKTQVTVSPDNDGDTWNIGGSWDFKFLQLMGYYGETKISDLKQANWFIGATAPIGLWTLKASYGQMSRDGSSLWGVATPGFDGQKANQLALGATYDISKRTALYATWSGINNKDNARFIVAPLNNIALGGSQVNENSYGVDVGIKHSF